MKWKHGHSMEKKKKAEQVSNDPNASVFDVLELVSGPGSTSMTKEDGFVIYMLYQQNPSRSLKSYIYWLCLALQEDADWDNISMKCDHIELYKLIEKCVLKQTSSKYPYLTLIEEMRGLLNYVQGDQTPIVYYEGMSNRVSICEKAGWNSTCPSCWKWRRKYSIQVKNMIHSARMSRVRSAPLCEISSYELSSSRGVIRNTISSRMTAGIGIPSVIRTTRSLRLLVKQCRGCKTSAGL